MRSYMNIDDQVEHLTEVVEKLKNELETVKEMLDEMVGDGEESDTNYSPGFASLKASPPPPEVKKAPAAKKK